MKFGHSNSTKAVTSNPSLCSSGDNIFHAVWEKGSKIFEIIYLFSTVLPNDSTGSRLMFLIDIYCCNSWVSQFSMELSKQVNRQSIFELVWCLANIVRKIWWCLSKRWYLRIERKAVFNYDKPIWGQSVPLKYSSWCWKDVARTNWYVGEGLEIIIHRFNYWYNFLWDSEICLRRRQLVGNKAKARQTFRKMDISYPLIRTSVCKFWKK